MHIPDQIITNYKLILFTLVIILIILFIYIRYQKKSFSLKIKKQLKRMSYDYIENIVLDDGLDQYAQFDYVLLTENGVIVLDIKDYSGHIFGADKIDEWTQIIQRKSYKFANPFFELSHKIELLKNINKEISVNGLILFADEADFPKGCPDKVISLKDLKDNYSKLTKQKIPVAMQKPWVQIKEKIMGNT